ncbi:MAG: hypothetical protein OXF79_19210 [Chloroflexi bacterium]|nr:hypothetical protein [Chloroflexota bacterium]
MSEGANLVVSRREDEGERQYRLVDQLLSMHSLLRDRYRLLSFFLNSLQIAASLFLCALAFVGDDVLQAAGLFPPRTRLALGLGALAVLIIAIAEYRVDWKAAGSRHGEAADRLGRLKALYRRNQAQENADDLETQEAQTEAYERTMSILPPIPERRFNRLKAHHLFKRALSDRLSESPKTFAWFLRVQLRLEGVRQALSKERCPER